MRILYVSALSSRRVVDKIYATTGINPGYAIQKFSRLVVEGFQENGVHTTALSNPPITRRENGSLWVSLRSEEENGIDYKYIPFINAPLIKHFCVFTYTFFYVLFWGIGHKKEKAIVCDVLSISNCFGALLASKLNRIKSVAVVTDIYSQMIGKKPTGASAVLRKTAGLMQQWYSTSFTLYVLLTEAMNVIVNPKHRPYIVMEALCERSYDDLAESTHYKEYPATILYAGGVEEKYGLKALVNAFRKISRVDIRLVIYGHGSYVNELKNVSELDKRIEYRGIAPNEEIVKAERAATLLVNPRFTEEMFARFSFPSKNMEYMTSGTPVLTTILPGMPKEYHHYVFLFDEGENVEGYASVIERVISLPPQELEEKGKQARRFVLREKNNLIQTKRIIQLISN